MTINSLQDLLFEISLSKILIAWLSEVRELRHD